MGAMGFSASYSKVGWYTYILYCVTVEHILMPSNFMFSWNSIPGPLSIVRQPLPNWLTCWLARHTLL